MSVQTLERPNRSHVGLFSVGQITDQRPKLSRGQSNHASSKGKNVLVVTDEPVFRSGTFRDSFGFQSTWEPLHMDQMVLNFNHLRDTNILPEIPVRKGHGSFLGDPMESLIGWHTVLRAEDRVSPHDGLTYRYLLASYEIFDEAAMQHVEDGDWRNRSSEIGTYLTNAEAEFWPAYIGFAFVDIPAVEGLNGFSNAVNRNNNFTMMMEAPVAENQNTGGQGTQSTDQQAGTPAAGTVQQGVEQQVTDTAQQVSQNDQGTNQTQAGSPTGEPSQPEATPGQGQVAQTGSEQSVQPQQNQHGASVPGAFAFLIGGQRTSDYSAVQAHINQLETSQNEQRDVFRDNFCKHLAETKKISATDLDSTQAFAKGLSDEQFTSWSQLYGGASEMTLFGQHGADAGDTGAPQSQAEKQTDQDHSDLVQIVRNHARTMPADKVKNTASFGKLKASVGDDKMRELGFGQYL